MELRNHAKVLENQVLVFPSLLQLEVIHGHHTIVNRSECKPWLAVPALRSFWSAVCEGRLLTTNRISQMTCKQMVGISVKFWWHGCRLRPSMHGGQLESTHTSANTTTTTLSWDFKSTTKLQEQHTPSRTAGGISSIGAGPDSGTAARPDAAALGLPWAPLGFEAASAAAAFAAASAAA